MPVNVDLSKLSPIVRKSLDPNGPAKLREGAARALLPGLKPADVITIVAILADGDDPALRATAADTLSKLPSAVLDGALSAPMPAAALDALSRLYSSDDAVLARLLENPGIDSETVADLAKIGSEALCERIATNEQRLLSYPIIVEHLYMNKRTRMSTADRVLELAVRNGLELDIPAFKEAAIAIQEELIPEPSEEPTPDDLLFHELDMLVDQIALDPDVEDTHELDDEGNEVVKAKVKPVWAEIANMTVTQKIRRAILGSSTERMLLVRDSNRLVAAAAIRSPLIKENEVMQISASRSVSDDVLRVIAQNREWTRHHLIKFNLVSNPRTPFTFASQLVGHLRDHELRALAKSKNVTGAIAKSARQHLARKNKQG